MCPNALRLGIYTQIANCSSVSRAPLTTAADGTVTVDVDRAIADTCTDSRDGVTQVPCFTQDQKAGIFRQIVHHEFNTMKAIPSSHSVETEDDMLWRFKWEGPKLAPPPTVRPTPGRKEKQIKLSKPGMSSF